MFLTSVKDPVVQCLSTPCLVFSDFCPPEMSLMDFRLEVRRDVTAPRDPMPARPSPVSPAGEICF